MYNGIVLNQGVNNVDGQVIIALDRLTLADPKVRHPLECSNVECSLLVRYNHIISHSACCIDV